ncbi:MAG: M23 family metallopeptidase [Clostridia bacterium]|nr:M23 family metallopeptidase [Clostridia bacterium]
MNEQNKNEKKSEVRDATQKQIKANAEAKPKTKKMELTKEKKFYLFTAIGCAAALIAIVIIAIAVTNANSVDKQANRPPVSSVIDSTGGADGGDTGNEGGGNEGDKPVIITPEGMIAPVATTTVGNDYGFYHNQTLNFYYEHSGVDFSASAGTEVLAAEDGKVESIYKADVLAGTEITIDHGNGLKTVYRFVTEAEHLKVGDSVKKGDVIATVAEATGEEYKDGAHLHFEVLENGKYVDPATHLTLEEK